MNLVCIRRVGAMVEEGEDASSLLLQSLQHVDNVKRAKELLGQTGRKPGWGWKILGKILGLA